MHLARLLSITASSPSDDVAGFLFWVLLLAVMERLAAPDRGHREGGVMGDIKTGRRE